MTSRHRTYQQQSRKAVQSKQNESPKKQQPQSQNEYQFTNLPAKAMINNVSRSSHSSSQSPLPLQAKLQIGEVGDKYEQEADRVAKQTVEQINAPQSEQVQRDILPQREEDLQMKSLNGKQPILQAKSLPTISPLNTSKISLQAKGVGGGKASQDLEENIHRAKSGGQSLTPQLQAKMGQAIGADFSNVKVHTDSQSDNLNQSLQAKAFTTGQHIFFKKSEYNPTSKSGQELIAHELTHVVQQNSSTVQCRNENAIIQKDEQEEKRKKSAEVKFLLPLLNSSPTIRKKGLSGVKGSDFVDLNTPGLKIPIKDISLFKAMSWYCKKEYSTENTNSILMMKALNIDSFEQIMAVTERFCQRLQNYKYDRYLPQTSYYDGGIPEDVNLPSNVMTKMVNNYTTIRNTTYDETDKRKPFKDWDIDLLVQAQIAMIADFEDVKKEVLSLLSDSLNRFLRNPEVVKAFAMINSLNSIPGGAMKARILGGYNESSDYPQTRKRR